MSRLPRILPLVAVAAGGVLALRALAGIEGAPDFLAGAKAWAEAAPAAAPAKGAPPVAAAANAASAAAVIASRPTAPVCAASATELARDAGLSPAELRVLQSLGERRGQLDAREQSFVTQVALLNAAETKVDAKMKALAALKAELTGIVSQANTQRDAEIVRLVKVYESMKPKDAAAVMATLDDRVLLPVAAKMKERNLAAILAQMPRPQAKALTEKLADRFNAANVAARVDAAVRAPAAVAPAVPPTTATGPAVASPDASGAPTPAAAPRRPARARPKPQRRPAAAAPAPAAPAAAAATPPAASVTAPPAAPPRPARAKPRGDGPT